MSVHFPVIQPAHYARAGDDGPAIAIDRDRHRGRVEWIVKEHAGGHRTRQSGCHQCVGEQDQVSVPLTGCG